jgi:hypothetical protein
VDVLFSDNGPATDNLPLQLCKKECRAVGQ